MPLVVNYYLDEEQNKIPMFVGKRDDEKSLTSNLFPDEQIERKILAEHPAARNDNWFVQIDGQTFKVNQHKSSDSVVDATIEETAGSFMWSKTEAINHSGLKKIDFDDVIQEPNFKKELDMDLIDSKYACIYYPPTGGQYKFERSGLAKFFKDNFKEINKFLVKKKKERKKNNG